MNAKEKDELYERAMAHFGPKRQLRKLQEECGELISAINRDLERGTREAEEALAAEVADVEIMIEQLRRIWKNDDIDQAKNHKLARLDSRLREAGR
jgi:NTP pyrophosphatase (non-canonical NTP hydrolase)